MIDQSGRFQRRGGEQDRTGPSFDFRNQQIHSFPSPTLAPSASSSQQSPMASPLTKFAEDIFVSRPAPAISNNALNLPDTKQAQPDLVVLTGWMDGSIKHLSKYSDAYRLLVRNLPRPAQTMRIDFVITVPSGYRRRHPLPSKLILPSPILPASSARSD